MRHVAFWVNFRSCCLCIYQLITTIIIIIIIRTALL
jgi:hypothetical protein